MAKKYKLEKSYYDQPHERRNRNALFERNRIRPDGRPHERFSAGLDEEAWDPEHLRESDVCHETLYSIYAWEYKGDV